MNLVHILTLYFCKVILNIIPPPIPLFCRNYLFLSTYRLNRYEFLSCPHEFRELWPRLLHLIAVIMSCEQYRSYGNLRLNNWGTLFAELTYSVALTPLCSTACNVSNGKLNSSFRVSGASFSFSCTCSADLWFSFEVKLPVKFTSYYIGIKSVRTEYQGFNYRRTVTDIESDLNKTAMYVVRSSSKVS